MFYAIDLPAFTGAIALEIVVFYGETDFSIFWSLNWNVLKPNIVFTVHSIFSKDKISIFYNSV